MDLSDHKTAFNSVGWFVPPYLQLGYLTQIKDAIVQGRLTQQNQLGFVLSMAYGPQHLAAMVCERYPATPFVSDHQETIGEAIEAHFAGQGHVAVAGLVPVIEGVGRKLLASRSLTAVGIKSVFSVLADDCKTEVQTNNIGEVAEVVVMLDSFLDFATQYLYNDSSLYSLSDRTNRHGITHGAYADADYGDPINFYKVVSALDFLCFLVALRAHVSWLAPDPTPRSQKLAQYYLALMAVRALKPLP